MSLWLRALEPEDLDVLYRVENDTALWYCGTTTAPYSRYVLRQYIQSVSGDAFHDGQVRFAIQTDDATVGFVDLVDLNAVNRRAEVAIVILDEYRCSGYATEALRLIQQYAQQLHLHQLYAYVGLDNVVSQQLFQRAGYVQSATLPDWTATHDGWQDVKLFTLRVRP